MTVDPPLGILAVASVADRPKWVTIRGSTVSLRSQREYGPQQLVEGRIHEMRDGALVL
jgi:hypothetical protein